MAVTRKYRLNLRNYGAPPSIQVSQYDEGYALVFEVYDGPSASPALNAYDIKLRGVRSDTLAFEFDGTVSGTNNNVLSFTIDTTMTGYPGRGVAEIAIIDSTNDVLFASFNINVFVEKAARPDDAVDADVTRAQSLAEQVQAIVDTAKDEVEAGLVDVKGDLSDIEDRVEALEQGSGGTGGGVSTSVRQALLTLLKSAAYTETGLSDEIATIESWASAVTAISVSPSSASISGSVTQQLTATTTPTGGTVTWSSSNTAVATVSSSGLVTGVSNGTATITATSGDAHASCTVTVSGFATLVSIDATYTQTGTVTPEDSLSSLTSDLVVVATYDNSTTATLTSSQYTLSGQLTVGTSTITVSYGGKTTTFTVTVVQGDTLLYSWDFTDSMTDSVASKVATTNASQDSTGLHFNATTKYVEFPAVYDKDRTYEIDVTSILRSRTGEYGRLFMVDSDTATGQGGSGFVITGTKKSGDLFYMNGAWESNVIVSDSVDADGSYYDDSTVGFYIDDDGYISVYKDGTLLGTSANALAVSYDGDNIYIGSSADADALYYATFTAFRIYEGNKYGGA